MRLVVDTNILFSYFWKDSYTRKIFPQHELYAPEFALEEIIKYKKEIMKKFNLSDDMFEKIKFDLAVIVKFVPLEEYKKHLKVACPDPNDVDFFALATLLKVPIWSNDKRLKKQDKVIIYSTEEMEKFK